MHRDLPLDEIQRLYLEGETSEALATRYGVSPQTILRRVRQRGGAVRQRQEWQSGGPPAAPIDEQLRLLADGTRSTRDLAQELSVSEECVREHMVRLALPRLAAKARSERNHFWRGGRTVDVDGYVLIHAPHHPYATAAGYVREHRLVMERELGRYLEPGEVVDHIDGVKDHNDPVNLRLFATNRDHLAATLRGRVPNWTPDGRARIARGGLRVASLRAASRSASGSDDHP